MKLLHCLAVLLPLAASHAATFQPVGEIGDDNASMGSLGVSGDGTTVIGYRLLKSEVYQFDSLRWTAADGVQPLTTLSGADNAYAYAVSTDGSVIVGQGMTVSGNSGIFSAVRWTPNGIESLGSLGGQDYSVAWAVSGDGKTVVGDSEAAPIPGNTDPIFPFIWTEAGGMSSLPLPAAAVYGEALGVSIDASTIVGCYASELSPPHPIYWRAGMYHELPQVDGATGLVAEKVNADGSFIVGAASFSDHSTNAVRWSLSEGIVENLGNFGPWDITFRGYSAAKGISGDGEVVVGYSPDENGHQATVWTRETGLQCLLDVLESYYGLDLTGWTLTSATGISADGHAITGEGVDPEGVRRAWIATGVYTIPKLKPEVVYAGKKRIVTPRKRLVIRGHARNASSVRYSVGNSGWTRIPDQKNWSFVVRVKRGSNRILVRANGRQFQSQDLVRILVVRKKK
jgi:uncharacterized membrane protein